MDLSGTDREAIRRRLILTRMAVSGDSQIEFCRRTGIRPNTWNNYEAGLNRISHDEALKVCVATGVSLDWIYRGIEALLPSLIADKIREIVAAGDNGMFNGNKKRA